MYAEPAGLDHDRLADVLRAEWGVAAAEIAYLPVGFGTHHYDVRADDGTRWFLNLDEPNQKYWLRDGAHTALSQLERCLSTAAALRSIGLEFVHAPVLRRAGGTVAPLGRRYALSLYPYLDGSAGTFDDYRSDGERQRVLTALGRMHATTDDLPPGLALRSNLGVPGRDRFERSLSQLSRPWTGGPYAERARALIADRLASIRELGAHYDELAARTAASDQPWVITHGEPHGGNVMHTVDGHIHLIDWDTVALGPRERDLWMVAPASKRDWAAYAAGGSSPSVEPGAIEMYRVGWSLADICSFTDQLYRRHVDDPNTQATWTRLQTYLS